MSESVKKSIIMLKSVSRSGRFSNRFLQFLNRLFLESIEIENVNRPTIGAGMFLGISVGKNYVKFLSALLAANRFCDRKIPFHIAYFCILSISSIIL